MNEYIAIYILYNGAQSSLHNIICIVQCQVDVLRYITLACIILYILLCSQRNSTKRLKYELWDVRVYDNSKECDRFENYERRFVTNDGLRMRKEGIR